MIVEAQVSILSEKVSSEMVKAKDTLQILARDLLNDKRIQESKSFQSILKSHAVSSEKNLPKSTVKNEKSLADTELQIQMKNGQILCLFECREIKIEVSCVDIFVLTFHISFLLIISVEV